MLKYSEDEEDNNDLGISEYDDNWRDNYNDAWDSSYDDEWDKVRSDAEDYDVTRNAWEEAKRTEDYDFDDDEADWGYFDVDDE